jgi:aerobic-type carbon monoxide dehydrogenase small subunit (CoxS/CutS family)
MGNDLSLVAKRELTVFVNGAQRHVSVDPSTSLATWLRTRSSFFFFSLFSRSCLFEFALNFLYHSLGLTGTKVGCGTGACGACTVMVSRLDYDSDTVSHITVNACLVPVSSVDWCHVTTVEGSDVIMERVKDAFVTQSASQCGFCTPGFVWDIFVLCCV